MQGFVSEGRVHGGSLISNAPEHGYFAASGYDVFALWAGTGGALTAQASPQQAAIGGGAMQYRRPEYAGEQNQAPTPYTRPTIGQSRPDSRAAGQSASPRENAVYIIMAEIRSSGSMVFLKTLQSHGPAQRIGDTVWLLRCGQSAEQLRNNLSQVLDRQDRLFIADANAGQPAWFNIGADLDHRIRDFWTAEAGED